MNIKEFKKIVKELLDDELKEASTTGGVPGYLTPKAFSKTGKTDNAGVDTAKSQGYTKAPETDKWFKKMNEAIQLSEITYKEYKKAPGMSSKHKLNNAIKECNRALFEIERYLKQNKKLREEEGLGLNEYWKSTAVKLVRMNERLKSLQKEIKNFGLKEILSKIQEEDLKKIEEEAMKSEKPSKKKKA